MKMELKYSKNIKYLVLGFGGIIFMCFSYLIHAFNPLEMITDKVMHLSDGSFLFKLWSEPPYEVLIKMYAFNVTNAEAFLNGKEKLRFDEIGPYVFQERLLNSNGHFNENDTLTFKQIRHLLYRPELSKGDLMNDIIISPNIPLLAISSVLSKYGWFLNIAPSRVIDSVGANTFVNLSINEYLWGYNDPLVKLANTFIPGWIDFPKFGLFDRLMAVDNASNVVTIMLNEKKVIKMDGDLETIKTKLPYSVDRFNGSPGLRHWGYDDQITNETLESNTQCNTVEGSYDGGLFPRHLKENTTLYLYRRAFCRPVEINYRNTAYSRDGIKIYNYSVNERFLASPHENSDNRCYCSKHDCLPSGFGSLAPCYYNFPIVISQPHFLNADPVVFNQMQGLKPDKEKHDTVLQLNPDLGVPVAANLRIQINLKVAKTVYADRAKKFSDMMIPLFWLELNIDDIPPNLKTTVILALNVFPVVQEVLKWLLGIIGLSMVGASALIIFYFPPEHRLEDPFGNRIGYSPILVLPIPQHLKSDLRISK